MNQGVISSYDKFHIYYVPERMNFLIMNPEAHDKSIIRDALTDRKNDSASSYSLSIPGKPASKNKTE
jgi:hypothetical protein